MLVDEFAKLFRDEHREIRDTLFEVIDAFRDEDHARIRAAIAKTAELTGPHFRYEEEALYPSLVSIFGEDYVEKLLSDHDRAIGAAAALAQLSQRQNLNDTVARRATNLVRAILPHVSDCEGLSIMAELLPDDRIRAIMMKRETCKREGLDLIRWANEVRKRRFADVEVDARR
jgi:hypothetical protein